MQKGKYKHSDKVLANMRKPRPSRKGQLPWNKGLTKDQDSRIAKAGHKLSKTLKSQGLRKGSNNPMFGHPSGMKGKKHTEETRLKMSISQKEAWKHRRSL